MRAKTYVRDLEELVDLQDKAIQALQQASKALELALQALQQSLLEKGTQQKMFQQPYLLPNYPTQPIQVPMPYIGDYPTQPMQIPMPYIGDPQQPNWVTSSLNGLGQTGSVVNISAGDFQGYNNNGKLSQAEINKMKSMPQAQGQQMELYQYVGESK